MREGQEEELKAIKVRAAASEEDFECEAEVWVLKVLVHNT